MRTDEDGRIFVLDEHSGRLIILSDRGLDGRVDLQRSLPHRFEAPTGLTLREGEIFIADRQGVWTINRDGSVHLLASLKNAQARDGLRDLGLTQSGRLRLGFNRQDGTASIVDIDLTTGEAQQIESANGDFIGFTRGRNAPLWIISEIDGTRRMGPTLSQSLTLPDGTQSVFLDGQKNDLILATPESILRATLGLSRLNVEETPLVHGFVFGTRQVRRGKPGPLLKDKRGLFWADQERGQIWRLVKEDNDYQASDPSPDLPSDTDRIE